MRPDEKEGVLRDLLAAWNADDWERIEDLHDPDIVAVAAQGSPESGTFEGWDAVQRQYARIKDSWESERAELIESSATVPWGRFDGWSRGAEVGSRSSW